MSSTKELHTKIGDAPRVVIYTNDDDTIATAYIVADEAIKVKIPQPTMAKVIAGLLSSYYIWHRDFPPGYLNILQFIDYSILGSDLKINCSPTTIKFIRKLCHTLDTNNVSEK